MIELISFSTGVVKIIHSMIHCLGLRLWRFSLISFYSSFNSLPFTRLRRSHLSIPWRLCWSCSSIHTSRTCSIFHRETFLCYESRMRIIHSGGFLIYQRHPINSSSLIQSFSWRHRHITKITRRYVSSWAWCFISFDPIRSLIFRPKSSCLNRVKLRQCLRPFGHVSDSFVNSRSWNIIVSWCRKLKSSVLSPPCGLRVVVLRRVIPANSIKLKNIFVGSGPRDASFLS